MGSTWCVRQKQKTSRLAILAQPKFSPSSGTFTWVCTTSINGSMSPLFWVTPCLKGQKETPLPFALLFLVGVKGNFHYWTNMFSVFPGNVSPVVNSSGWFQPRSPGKQSRRRVGISFRGWPELRGPVRERSKGWRGAVELDSWGTEA